MKLGKFLMTGVIAIALAPVTFGQTAINESAAVQVEEAKIIAAADVVDADKEIKVSELPEAVKNALTSDAYKGWEAKKAWIIEKDAKTLYQVEVVKGDETATLLFDKNGASID